MLEKGEVAAGSVRFILFDLDNTLYPRESGLFSRVDQRINRYLEKVVILPAFQVNRIRQEYLREYGTTLSGLMEHHGVDPLDYLEFVHDVPVEQLIATDNDLPALLAGLPGEKYVFSNASRQHCDKVLDHLQIADFFTDIYDIIRMDFQSKPELKVYERIVAEIGDPAGSGIMVDDLAANLLPARKLGMRTVLIDSQNQNNPVGSPPTAVLSSIHQLPEFMSSVEFLGGPV
jgi:putative hydrolase of the HAD superfamily